MGMQINTNMAANNAYRSLSNTQNDVSKSLEKLSSGFRINRAGDDAAGLALSEGLKSQIGGLTVASRNAQDGIGAVQTAEGGLSQAQNILQRLRDLGVQAANDTNSSDSRAAITNEATKLTDELGRIAASTDFNTTKMLNGTTGSMSFQVGANTDASSTISLDLSKANLDGVATALKTGGTTQSATLGNGSTPLDSAHAMRFKQGDTTVDVAATNSADNKALAADLNENEAFSKNFTAKVNEGGDLVVSSRNASSAADIEVASDVADDGVYVDSAANQSSAPAGAINFDNATNARAAVDAIDAQIAYVSTGRAELGATQNRLESAVQTINVAKENLTASNSRIRDTDMAEEMVKFTRNNILSQAGTAMLAQANQSNQGVLQLLR